MGADNRYQTVGAIIATGVSALTGRPVRLTNIAVIGAESSGLELQLANALDQVPQPHVAVIMVGANDVTHRIDESVAVRHLESAVQQLRDVGAEVVVGTCPDLGTIEPIPQPLRLLGRRWSRDLAAAQTVAVVEAGGRTVSLGDLLGPEFAERPHEMFSQDRFHPSPAGYARCAAALLPSVYAALGVWEGTAEEERLPDRRRGEGVGPVALAAEQAVRDPGTEVSADRDRRPGPRAARPLGEAAAPAADPRPPPDAPPYRPSTGGRRPPGTRERPGPPGRRDQGHTRRRGRTAYDRRQTKRPLTQATLDCPLDERNTRDRSRHRLDRPHAHRARVQGLAQGRPAGRPLGAGHQRRAGQDPRPRPVDGRGPLLGLRRAVGPSRLQHGPGHRRAGRVRPPARARRSTGSAPRPCRPRGWPTTRSRPARATSSSPAASSASPSTPTGPAPAAPPATTRTRGSPTPGPAASEIAKDNATWTDPRAKGLLPDVYLSMGQTAENVATLARHLPRAAGRVGRDQPEPRREGHRRRVLRARDRPGHAGRRHGREQGRRPPRRRHPRGRLAAATRCSARAARSRPATAARSTTAPPPWWS